MRALLSITVSLIVHALLAFLIVCWFRLAPSPDVAASLDLSSVELSLSDEDVTSAPPLAAPSVSASRPKTPLRVPDAVRPETAVGEVVMPALDAPVPPEAAEVTPDLPERASEALEAAPAPPAPAPQQARIEAPPRPQRAIRPVYPTGSRFRREEGDVVLALRVDALGFVVGASVATSSGFGELDKAAVKAALSARFDPAKVNGLAVASEARLKLSFRLK